MRWKRVDGPELDGPEIFLKKLPKSINEIWTVFKLINKLHKNYNENDNGTEAGEATYAGALRTPRAGSPTFVSVLFSLSV